MLEIFKKNWPNYLFEAAGLGLFMVSACVFATILYHPSFIGQKISTPLLRDALMGAAMGLTAIAIIYSPFGRRSGAHINPSITLTFFRLGKVHPHDTLFYVLAQFAGGTTGVLLSAMILGPAIKHPSINYVVTVPGKEGLAIAFLAETVMAFVVMTLVLNVSNNKRLAHWTGIFAGMLVATYITFEQSLSGMSINPARTFASALLANTWTGIWIYFIAPPLGMLLAAETYRLLRGQDRVACAKLRHANKRLCIFCDYQSAVRRQQSAAVLIQEEQIQIRPKSLAKENNGQRATGGGPII